MKLIVSYSAYIYMLASMVECTLAAIELKLFCYICMQSRNALLQQKMLNMYKYMPGNCYQSEQVPVLIQIGCGLYNCLD